MPKRRGSSEMSSSSDDEEVNETKKRNVKATSSKIVVSSDSSSSSDDDGEWNAKPKSKKKKKTAKKQATKTVKKKLKTSDSDSISSDDDDDDQKMSKGRFDEKEEGEVDFSENELGEFDDGWDENLMGDEEDQAKLAQMTEKEREQELFNRSEKREVLRTRFEIERKLRLAKKQEMKKKEKNFDSLAYTETTSRSVERRRNMEDKRKVKDAIKGLKLEREKKKEKLKQKLRATDVYSDSSDSDSNSDAKPSKKNAKSSSSEYSSSSISDDDSDADVKKDRKRDDSAWDKDRASDHEPEEQFTFTIEHLNSIRLSRFKMEKWCHAPFFKDSVAGCFVRISSGTTHALPTYFVAQIVDVIETAKIYMLGKTRTNKGIKVRHAKNSEKVYRLEYVSNSEFTPTEFDKWYAKMISDKCEFPTKEFVENKKADIQKALNYNYSEADIELIVAEKERFKDNPVNFAMKKSLLLKEKEYAELNGDIDKAFALGKEIDRLDDEAKRRDKIRTQNIAAIAFINERNRMRNIIEAGRAIAEEAKESQNNKDDPFTRRKCTPTMIHVFKNKQPAPETLNLSAAEEQKSAEKPAPEEPKEVVDKTKNSMPKSNSTKTTTSKSTEQTEDVNDMFNVHNFDIKIDFENLNFSMSNSNPSSMSTPASNGLLSGFSNGNSNGFPSTRPLLNSSSNRRSLNLDEYKKKKGLI